MPETLPALLILLFGLLPGVAGEQVYRTLIGIDWRESNVWPYVFRILTASVSGLVFYSLASQFVFTQLPPPIYVLPETFNDLNVTNVTGLFVPLAGHTLGSILAGFLAVVWVRLLSRVSPASAHPSAWNDFVRTYVPGHWVVVTLTSGETYAGILDKTDISVQHDERDIILKEPALYSESESNYISTRYQYLFIAAETVAAIGAVYDPNLDKDRMVQVNQPLFSKPQTSKEESSE